jgi:hypothetical protein
MSDSYTSWKQPYLEAQNETDKNKLTELVYAAEEAIFRRMLELSGSADHHEERSELKEASAALMAIQVHKLGWPAPLPGIGNSTNAEG